MQFNLQLVVVTEDGRADVVVVSRFRGREVYPSSVAPGF